MTRWGLTILRCDWAADFPGYAVHQKEYHMTLELCSGSARDGSPVQIEATPLFNFDGLFSIDPAVADRYLMFCFEYGAYLLDSLFLKTGRQMGHVKIMDLNGIKMSQISVLRKWQSNVGARKERLACDIMECYPESFSKVLVGLPFCEAFVGLPPPPLSRRFR